MEGALLSGRSLREERAAERQLHELRPLGEAYLARRFDRSLSRADAEDAVAEVVIRLQRRISAGEVPRNLRAAFFTSVRNAAIDHLRWHAARPTVALEAASEAPAEVGLPVAEAERREDGVRLQEALGRMRPNYREAIVLRFGVGLTVPEIAERLGISLPAAKKIVLRATAQIRKRVEAIEGHEFCAEMRDAARRSLFEKEAAGLASESERRVLESHFKHCGACKTFLSELHRGLHDLGSAAVFAGLTGGVAGHAGVLARLGEWFGGSAEAAHTALEKGRAYAFKASGAWQPADAGGVGALGTTVQKVAAVCGAATATAATCVATGLIGPGIGAQAVSHGEADADHRSAPVVRELEVPPPEVPAPTPEPVPSSSTPEPAPGTDGQTQVPAAVDGVAQPASSPAEQASEEFGFESSASAESAPEPVPAPATAPSPSPSPAPAASGGGGQESFGFGG